MWEDDIALCLTPQTFSNISVAGDLFNNINKWECTWFCCAKCCQTVRSGCQSMVAGSCHSSLSIWNSCKQHLAF